MDKSERIRLKQLVVDAIAEYPVDHPIIPFAEALEKCVDADYQHDLVPHCPTCNCLQTNDS